MPATEMVRIAGPGPPTARRVVVAAQHLLVASASTSTTRSTATSCGRRSSWSSPRAAQLAKIGAELAAQAE
jgi:hypothetical protein